MACDTGLKPCKKCGKTDVKFGFRYNKQNNKHYERSDCVECQKKSFSEWQLKNTERNRKRAIEHYYKNKAVPQEIRKRRSGLTNEQRAQAKRDKANNRASFAKHATVKWEETFTEFCYSEAHELRKLRKHITGIDWNVDHIIPLKGKKVCGLHVWNNFQVITKYHNIKKGNSHVM